MIQPKQLPEGWRLLPRSVQLRGKCYPVGPSNGHAYLKGSETVVFLRDVEGRVFATVCDGQELTSEQAAALVRELLPECQLRPVQSVRKMFEVYAT